MHRFWLFVLVISCSIGAVRLASAQSIDELQKSLQSATDPKVQAKLAKQLGDQFVAQDKLPAAAATYLRALQTGRENFSLTERLQIAIYLSWADRLSESKRELEAILDQDQSNLAARTHLARVLAWSGDLNEAVTEADAVLRAAPNHKEALLVKADALQWQGRYLEAIAIYRKQVVDDGDFDARLGLAHSLLALGRRTEVAANFNALKAGNAGQRRELAKLADAIDRETSPTLESRYNHYHDSDRNNSDRYAVTGGFWFGNQKMTANFRHTEASDPHRYDQAEDFAVKTYRQLTERVGGGIGLGFTQLRDGHTTTFPVGHARLDAKLLSGSVGAHADREVLSDTAELIQNRIRMTTAGLNVTQSVTDRVSVSGNYLYKNFSDSNHANELQLASQYAIYLSPRITIGYRFRLLDFEKQSHSGYFDPNNYIANRAFSSLYFENKMFYTYVEAYVGYETFRRYGVATDNVVHGGASSLGIKPIANLAIEVNIEGGNFAAGSTAGFNYFVVGPRVMYRF
jgi:tetratricopeptide (TPR) repeat protein